MIDYTVRLEVKKGYIYGVMVYYDSQGNRIRKWISTGLLEHGNKRQAKEMVEKRAKEMAIEVEQERTISSGRARRASQTNQEKKYMNFVDYVAEYIEERKPKLSETSYYNYSHTYIIRFREYFKNLRLIDITEDEINGFYASERKRGIKDITLRHYNCVLRPALRQAFLNKLIPDNPFDFLEPLPKKSKPITFYDQEEMKELLKKMTGHPMEVPFKLAAYYGFRRSEVLALRWSAVDFEHKLISVNKKIVVINKVVILSDELKTKTSNRTLPLLPPVEKLLLEQKKWIEHNKEVQGIRYMHNYDDYICVDEVGKIIYPDHLSNMWQAFIKDNKLRHIRFHDLRHSVASNMLANGVPLKEIQDWLGHADFSTTANIYSHLDFSSKVKAADLIVDAYSDEPKKEEKKEEKKESDVAMTILKLERERKRLGFKSLEDYLEYLKDNK